MADVGLKAEANVKAQKILLSLQKKHKNDLAAMYAEAEATASKLEYTADTYAQVKKAVYYDVVKKQLKESIVVNYMSNAGYEFSGSEEDPFSYCWRKEGADNGNNNNN